MQFLLAYHYLAQGNNDAAGAQFQKVRRAPAQRPALGGVRQALQEGDRGRGRRAGGQPAGAAQPARCRAGRSSGSARRRSPPISPRRSARAGTGRRRRTIKPSSPSRPRLRPPAWSERGRPSRLPTSSIALTLEADGKFAWEVDTKGKKQTLNGVAGFKDNTLALLQQDGPPLVGKVTQDGANKFVFAPDGAGDKAPGLTFTR